MNPTIDDLVKALESLPQDRREFYVGHFLEEINGDQRWEELLERPESESVLSQMLADVVAEVEDGQVSGDTSEA